MRARGGLKRPMGTEPAFRQPPDFGGNTSCVTARKAGHASGPQQALLSDDYPQSRHTAKNRPRQAQ